MNKDKILIIGATGTVGSEIARLLELDGHTVLRATSKTPKQGQVQIDLATGEGIDSAMEEVDKAFLLSPPGYADHYKILSPLITAAKKHNLKKIVLMTAMGANADENSPFRRAEVELENSGLNYNIVRPNWFMQNFNTFWVQPIKEQKLILLPAGDAKTSFIDSRDISAVVAKLLTSSEFDNRDFDITGPQALDHNQVASKITDSISSEVIYEDIEPATLRSELVNAGLPADYVDFLLLIFGFLKEGYNAGVTENVEKILGRKPHNFEQYANDYSSAWE